MNTKDIIEHIKQMANDADQIELLKEKKSTILSALSTIENSISIIKRELGEQPQSFDSSKRTYTQKGSYNHYYDKLLLTMSHGEGIRPRDAGIGQDFSPEELTRVIASIYYKLTNDVRIEKRGKVFYMKDEARVLFSSEVKS